MSYQPDHGKRYPPASAPNPDWIDPRFLDGEARERAEAKGLACCLMLLAYAFAFVTWSAVLIALALVVPGAVRVYALASAGVALLVAASLLWRRLRPPRRRGQEAKLDASVERELRHAQQAGVFDPDELLVEIEAAMLGWSSGALIVTDKRVLFVSTSLFRRKTEVTSITLSQVESAQTAQTLHLGELALTITDLPSPRVIEIDQIPGGLARATEIANSIVRERVHLLSRLGHEHA